MCCTYIVYVSLIYSYQSLNNLRVTISVLFFRVDKTHDIDAFIIRIFICNISLYSF